MKETKTIIPNKISKGSHIRVVAPSRSLKLLSQETINYALERFKQEGFKISFGKHVAETDSFNSASVTARVLDMHEAFQDKSVDAVLTVIGGYNSNQLLKHLDYNLIANNPKIICGFSDITVLINAITSKTGMVTYLGPHFSSWAMRKGFEYSLELFKACCMENKLFNLQPATTWSDDPWYIDQENRHFIQNEGYWLINAGEATGRVVGGHIGGLVNLQGTEYWPNLNNSILCLEGDADINPMYFDRNLESLTQQKDFSRVQGILIGRFQKGSGMNKKLLQEIIYNKSELSNIPVIANIDFGHTTPIATIPIGGQIEMFAKEEYITLKVKEH